MASIFNIRLISIKISICGICAVIEQKNKNMIINLLIYVAGPLSNLFLALIFINQKMIFELNMFLFILNVLPIYPLDGSKIINLLISNKKTESMISNIFLYIISIISIYQIIKYKSFSFIIFFMYLLSFKLLNDKYNKKILKK
jgi:stage IV sporulation protein FB